MSIIVNTGPIGTPGEPGVPIFIQEKIWKLIDSLHLSGLNSPYIKVVPNFSTLNGSIEGKNYSVEYSGRDGFSLNFITSDSYGIWGIDKIITVEEILRLISEEIRQSKLDHLLNFHK